MNSFNPSVSSVSNSNSEADILSVTIPANSIADGDYIDLSAQCDFVNGTGSPAHVALHGKFGGDSLTISNGVTVGANKTLAGNRNALYLIRQGSSLKVSRTRDALATPNSNVDATWTPDFTVDNDLKITAQWDVADASISATCNSGKVVQY